MSTTWTVDVIWEGTALFERTYAYLQEALESYDEQVSFLLGSDTDIPDLGAQTVRLHDGENVVGEQTIENGTVLDYHPIDA